MVEHFPSDLRMTEIARIWVIGLAKAHEDAFFAHVAHSCYVSGFGGGFCMHNANVLRVLSPTAESNCGLLQGAVLAIWTIGLNWWYNPLHIFYMENAPVSFGAHAFFLKTNVIIRFFKSFIGAYHTSVRRCTVMCTCHITAFK